MKTATLAAPRSRWIEFVEMTKPRISAMVLLTVFIGAACGALSQPGGVIAWSVVLNVLAGVALTASGATVLNQWLERDTDGAMARTRNRPLPSGRLSASEVLVFGIALSVAGVAWLALTSRTIYPTLLSTITLLSYVFIYTPLKRVSTLNTLIGAAPGALPPAIGWSASTGSIDTTAWLMVLVVFLWQVPHFLAIAWIYRRDYGAAGLKMLPVIDPQGHATARQMVIYCLALLPVSLLPVLLRQAGWFVGVTAIILGLVFLKTAWDFARQRTDASARTVLFASLAYLSGFFLVMLVETLLRRLVMS